MSSPLRARIEEYLRTHEEASSAPVLARALGVSQPTFARAVAGAGDSILKIGRARATRYVLRRQVGRTGNQWPLYRLDESGRAERLGILSSVGSRGFHLLPDRPLPAFLSGEFADGLFPGLPWFLDGLRPQGFLGRAFARRMTRTLGVPEDLTRWSDDDVLVALLAHGEDGNGDLVVGEAAMQAALSGLLSPAGDIPEDETATRYPELAERALRGEIVGSSAGGEQPKFAATLATATGRRAVLVKFSDRTDTPGGQRWADLLVAEAIAGEVLGENGFAAATSITRRAGGRVFLESTRFDRTPDGGRRGFVPLSALDAAFYGNGAARWQALADRLATDGWITRGDAERLRLLGWFGDLIANDDMHLGNVGLRLTDERPFELVPAYDMLPMHLRPVSSGEVVPRTISVRLPLPEQREDWKRIAPAALQFWATVRDHREISPVFARIAEEACQKLEEAMQRV